MFVFLALSCLLIVIISIYLILSPMYRIRNWHGFALLLFVFMIRLLYICTLPCCQMYLLYFLIFVDIHSFQCYQHTIIVSYCMIETFFFAFTVEEARFLHNRLAHSRAPLPRDYDQQFVDRILDVYEKSHDDIRVCFAGWFQGKHITLDSIYEDNILEYMAAMTYGVKYFNEMTDKQQEHIRRLWYEGYLARFPEQRSKIKSGFNRRIRMRHPYRDPIRYTPYPLMKYIMRTCFHLVGLVILKKMGYCHKIMDNVSFYVKLSSKTSRSPPILFVHGLSTGISAYLLFIHRLTSLNRTIILLDLPYVGMCLNTEVLPMSTIVSSIVQLLDTLGEDHLATIGHSYGTFIQACIVKQAPHLVRDQPVIFIDPGCFLVFDSRYSYNFIYRHPHTPNQYLLHVFCTQDLYAAYAIERHLCWYECNLWAEDIRQSQIRTHVFLSEDDDLVPISFVREYLNKSKINTTVIPHFKHAQFLIAPQIHDAVIRTLFELEISHDNESVCF